MPSLFEIQKETEAPTLVKMYVQKLSEKTNRNSIVYYSGWLSAQGVWMLELMIWIRTDSWQ